MIRFIILLALMLIPSWGCTEESPPTKAQVIYVSTQKYEGSLLDRGFTTTLIQTDKGTVYVSGAVSGIESGDTILIRSNSLTNFDIVGKVTEAK